MPDDATTDKPTEPQPLDIESWEIALEAYEGNPGSALMLGFHLTVLLSYLKVEPLKIQEAVEGIERGLETLYPHTQFNHVCHEMFLKVVGGKLTVEEEEALKKLGLHF